jgi:hypothetical protein
MISIKGVKVVKVEITVDDNGNEKVEGTYHLMSNSDKVLAKQSFNGYSDIKVDWSAEARIAIAKVMGEVKKDVQMTLGLNEKGE